MYSKLYHIENSKTREQAVLSPDEQLIISSHIWIYAVCRVATVREKYLENEIFSRSGKSQGILWMSGKFRKDSESQGKVREFENKWQAVLRKFVYSVQEGKDEHSPSTLGATRKGKN